MMMMMLASWTLSRRPSSHTRTHAPHCNADESHTHRQHRLQGDLLERPRLRDAVQGRRSHEEAIRQLGQRDAGRSGAAPSSRTVSACSRHHTLTYVPALCVSSMLTQILKVAGFDKPQRTRVLEREVQKGTHEKVQGGYGKYQGGCMRACTPNNWVNVAVRRVTLTRRHRSVLHP